MPKAAPKKRQHYVDNKEFLAAIIKYKEKVEHAKDKGLAKPRVNDYIGGCFLKIATHLSYRPNFINYMYKDDMVCDGIENCIQYIDNFDPNKSRNPFAYFTQIVYYAFLRRIAKEKKQQDIKIKYLTNSGIEEFLTNELGEESSQTVITSFVDTLKERIDRVRQTDSEIKEYSKKQKIKAKRVKTVDSDLSEFLK